MTPIAKMGMLSSALLWLVTGCASDAPVYVKPAQPARGADVIEPRSLDAAAAAPRTDPQLDQRMSQMEGRLNDIIKTGGANVSPVEVDAVLGTCPGVKITKTVGVPDELLGERVVACIVPADGARLSEDEVRSFAKAQLAAYKVPRRVLFFAESELETTGSAKVKASALRELAAKRLAGEHG